MMNRVYRVPLIPPTTSGTNSPQGKTTGLGLIGGRSIVDVPASKSLAYACSTRYRSRSAFASTGSATLQLPRKPLLADYFTGTRLMPRVAHR